MDILSIPVIPPNFMQLWKSAKTLDAGARCVGVWPSCYFLSALSRLPHSFQIQVFMRVLKILVKMLFLCIVWFSGRGEGTVRSLSGFCQDPSLSLEIIFPHLQYAVALFSMFDRWLRIFCLMWSSFVDFIRLLAERKKRGWEGDEEKERRESCGLILFALEKI